MLDEKQLEIVNSTEPRIIVEAGGGSGKTRTLIERVKKLLKDGVEPSNMVCITFTNMAAEEMKERLIDVPGIGDCFIGTIHSFANRIFKNSDETYKLYTNDIEDQFMTVLTNLYAKHLTIDKYLIYKDIKKKIDLGQLEENELELRLTPAELYEISVFMGDVKNEEYKENIKTLCKKYNVITFDELLKKTTEYFKEINGKVEYLFVDEFQDIGPLERDFFKALNADNYFYIGDEKQCQPAGTLITMSDGSFKKIEDLRVGDEVLSYDLKQGHYNLLTRKGKGKKILEISKHIENDFIEVVTEKVYGKYPLSDCSFPLPYKSKYTKNHKCLARIHYDGNENKSVVYIMENEAGFFRVGSTKLFTFNDRNFGLRGRINTENAINGWILGVYENKSEAWIEEQICAYKFGIPQTTWTCKETTYSKEDLSKMYFSLGDIRKKAISCLKHYGRDINYPLFTKNTNKHFSKIHLTEIQACNLIPEVMDVAIPYKDKDNKYKNKYLQIKEINLKKIPHKVVYGLKVEDTETYVADGILTHNSIYGFKGGNVSYFLNLIKSKNWKTYYLNNNYRCGQAIIELANRVIMQADDIINVQSICKSNNPGITRIDSKYKIDDYLKQIKNYKDWFVLVRTNKDLAKLEQKMNDLEIPFVSFRKGEINLDEMRKCMAEDKIKLLTIHTSKGLESKNVLLWGNFPIVQKPYLRNNDEIKVLYVGITRGIDQVILLN